MSTLDFPGRKAVKPPRLGPFNQPVEKDGILVRIGGSDNTAHATIEDSENNHWIFEVTREMAVALGHHLYVTPMRIIGTGRFFRNEDGQWQNVSLRGVEFETLSADSLLDVVGHNPRRRHSALDYQSPVNFERKHQENSLSLNQSI